MRRSTRLLTSSLPIAVVAACAVVLVVYWSAAGIEHELSRTSIAEIEKPTSKYNAWRSAITLVADSPLSGVGRGGFETSFSRVHASSGQATFSHLENEYLQAVIDWGVPASILLAVAMFWLVFAVLRRWREGALAAAALGALTAIAVQSNVDFGIELLGLAIPVTVLAATLAYRPVRPVDAKIAVRIRALRGAHVAALVGGAIVLLSSVTTTLEEDRARVAESPHPEVVSREAATRHPLDYYAYAAAAKTFMRAGDPRGTRLLNHAMTLHPNHPGLHLIAARLLLRSGYPEQAASEYALTLRNVPDPQRLLPEVVEKLAPPIAVTAIPYDVPDLKYTVDTLQKQGHGDLAVAWLARVLQFRPRDPKACDLLYTFALRHGSLAALETASRGCPDMIPDQQTRFALARLMSQKAAHSEVVRLLSDIENWQGRIDQNVTAWLLLCDSLAALSKWDDAKRCLRRLDATGDMQPERHGEIDTRLEQLEQRKAERAGITPPPETLDRNAP